MGWTQAKPIPPKARCNHCGLRYKQRAGLCAYCWRQLDDERRTVQQLETAERLAEEARIKTLRRVEEPRVPREIVVDGIEWIVMFDGS